MSQKAKNKLLIVFLLNTCYIFDLPYLGLKSAARGLCCSGIIMQNNSQERTLDLPLRLYENCYITSHVVKIGCHIHYLVIDKLITVKLGIFTALHAYFAHTHRPGSEKNLLS